MQGRALVAMPVREVLDCRTRVVPPAVPVSEVLDGLGLGAPAAARWRRLVRLLLSWIVAGWMQVNRTARIGAVHDDDTVPVGRR